MPLKIVAWRTYAFQVTPEREEETAWRNDGVIAFGVV